MDAVCEPEVVTVVLMFASQTGKTSIEENIVGFHIEQDPAPILFVMPTLAMAEAFSKDRLAPMTRDTPCLTHKIAPARSRDADNTLLHKGFPGGHITIAGANSPASLASRPIRILLCDEIDRYPPSAGTEGDPVSLADKRTTTFWNRKKILSGTPTIKGFSRIEDAFEESDQRHYYVPCPECGRKQVLRWKQVRWPEGQPDEARYCCIECGSLWSDVQRWRAVSKGEWEATKPFNGTAGFHLNEIYSPWVKLADTARNFLEAKPHMERLKVWINTALAETWEEDAEQLDPSSIEARAEEWGEPLPAGIFVITAGVDVQADRLEVEVVGWGPGEESWSIAHWILYGDPSAPEVWDELYEKLETQFPVEGKGNLVIAGAAIDTGGHHTQAVYAFCKDKFRRRFYAIKGMAGPGRPVWPKRASRNNKARVNLFIVGVDAAKDMVLSRLKLREAGPGYCHFPKGRDSEYFRQLTAEKVVTKYVKGFPTRVYVKDNNTRNEALDLRVYAYAALIALNVNWGRLQRHFEPKETPPVQHLPPDDDEDGGDSGPPRPDSTRSSSKRKPRRRRVVRSSYMNR